MNILIFMLLIMTIFLQNDVKCWRRFEFRFQSIQCTKYSDLASFVNCSLSNLPKQQKGLCFSLQASQSIARPKLDFLIETIRTNQANFVLANLTQMDGCDFLENRGGILNIIQIIRREFDKFSINMPKKCPMVKDSTMIVKDLILDPNNFPPYVPETAFAVTVRLWEKTVLVFDVIVSGNVTTRDRRLRLPINDSKSQRH